MSKVELAKLNLEQALAGLKMGEFSSRELVESCLARISHLDSELLAFITVTGDSALAAADIADREIKKLGDRAYTNKPLLGVPYACKDNFSTRGVQTTAGSAILNGYIPPYESTVTQKLADAGAILIGKTNMDAFAHGSSGETSDYKITKNPWDTTRVPGGSSAGSATAVAADLCIFSIGSETAASIRGPAAWCGITGLKPTYGRVSRYGLIAMASSADSPGPLTKSVRDAAYVLRVLAGKDPLDATTSPEKVSDYLAACASREGNLRGLKVGVPKSYFELDLEQGVRENVTTALAHLKELGAELRDIELISPKYAIAVYTIVQRSEVSSNLARFDGLRFGHTREAFGLEAKKRMMLGAYALSEGYYDQYYSKAQKVRTLIIQDFAAAFNKVDVIVGPTMPCTALKVGESAKSPMFGELMDILGEPSSVSGLPAISVNCGFSNGLPVGLQFIAPQFSEEVLFKTADVFQQSTSYHLQRPSL